MAIPGYDVLKDALKLADEFKRGDLKLRILDLIEKLSDSETERLKQADKIRELEQQLKTREEMRFDNEKGTYWRTGSDGKSEGPFCPKCWNEKGKAVPMAYEKDIKVNQCVVCNRMDGSPVIWDTAPMGLHPTDTDEFSR